MNLQKNYVRVDYKGRKEHDYIKIIRYVIKFHFGRYYKFHLL